MGLVFKMVNGWEIFGKLTLSSHRSEQSRRYSNLHEKEKKKKKKTILCRVWERRKTAHHEFCNQENMTVENCSPSAYKLVAEVLVLHQVHWQQQRKSPKSVQRGFGLFSQIRERHRFCFDPWERGRRQCHRSFMDLKKDDYLAKTPLQQPHFSGDWGQRFVNHLVSCHVVG